MPCNCGKNIHGISPTALAILSARFSHNIPTHRLHDVLIPGSDRFAPFALTIREGDSVRWTNANTDAHTIVSDDAVNSAGPRGVNITIPVGGTQTIRFDQPGLWVYYCRFHAHLDAFNQPIAPGCGPNGDEIDGIETINFTCGTEVLPSNFGTPMMGVISIQPREHKEKEKKKPKCKRIGCIKICECDC